MLSPLWLWWQPTSLSIFLYRYLGEFHFQFHAYQIKFIFHFHSQDIFMIANPIFLFLSMKLGALFVKLFSSKFFHLSLNHDIMDDFYSLLLIILSISVILQVTSMPNNEFKFSFSMLPSTMVLFGASSVLLAILVLLYM